MKIIRLIGRFYKTFIVASILITLICVSIVHTYGIATFTALFWFKIITLGIIVYHTNNYKKNEFYYYKNLGVSKLLLWIPSLLFDFVLFLVLIILTVKIR